MISSRARAAWSIAAMIAAGAAQAPASASTPRVNCIQAFASKIPEAKCDPSAFRHLPPATPDIITPLSRLYTYGANIYDYLGVVKVEGNASPGSRVTITITDGTRSLVRVASAAASDDANYGARAGDFEVLFDPTRDLSRGYASVQELGTHVAGPGATAEMPNPTPADLGQAVLTVEAVATLAGIDSAPMTVEIYKRPTTPGDVFAPELQNLRFPPQHWCHYAGKGASTPRGDGGTEGTSLGGQSDGTCSNFAVQGVGAVPDATWVLCTRYTGQVPEAARSGVVDVQRGVIDQHDATCDVAADCAGLGCSLYACSPPCDDTCATGLADSYGGLRNSYCRAPENQSMPTGHAPLSGRADDLAGAPDGFASEIASVTITITQGEAVLQTFTDWFARTNSTTAAWGWELNINDFAPNANGIPYVITVTATDAWGNETSESSQPITVYPY